MRPFVAILVFSLLSGFAQAADLSVVDVRKNIPLSDSEEAYKDFYIAGGSVSSLKKNMVVTALRRTSIRDAKGTQSYGEIDIPVGQLRILAVFGSVAVAREYKLLSRDEHPMLEQTGIMNGDRIETKDSFIDNKPAPKRKTAATTGSAAGTTSGLVVAAIVSPAIANAATPSAAVSPVSATNEPSSTAATTAAPTATTAAPTESSTAVNPPEPKTAVAQPLGAAQASAGSGAELNRETASSTTEAPAADH